MKNLFASIGFYSLLFMGGIFGLQAQGYAPIPSDPSYSTFSPALVRMETSPQTVAVATAVSLSVSSSLLSPTATGMQLVRMEDALNPLASQGRASAEGPIVLRAYAVAHSPEVSSSSSPVLARMEDVLNPRSIEVAQTPEPQGVLRRMADDDAPTLASRNEPMQLVAMASLPFDTTDIDRADRATRLAQRYTGERDLASASQTSGDAAQTAGGNIKVLDDEVVQAAREILSSKGGDHIVSSTQLAVLSGGEDEVFLELRVDGRVAGDVISARKEGEMGRLYLPLSVMMRELGFPIDVMPDMGVAKGWFMEEGRTFVLNEQEGYVEIAGKRMPLVRGTVRRAQDDIYVTEDQLAAWFPVEANVAWDKLVLDLRSTEVLPEAARLARQKLWDRYGTSSGLPTGPRHELARAMFGWPTIKLDYSTVTGNADSGSNLLQTLGVQAQGNLLGMDSYLALNFQQGNSDIDSLTGGRFRLSRDSISGTSGPFGVRHFELGDVTLPNIALLSNDSQGRGVSLNNKPVGFVGSLNEFELQGDAPIGWDVEVYQDEALLAFGNVSSDGRYQFSQLALRSGVNNFRIMLYGPQGQKEERRESYYLGEGMVKPGEWIYEAGLTESRNPLIAAGRIRQQEAGTLAVNSFYGINRNLTLNLGASTGPLGNTRGTGSGGNVGLRAAFGKSFSQADVAGFSDGGIALALRERYQLGKDMDIGAFYTRRASSTVEDSVANETRGVEFFDTVQLGVPFRYGLTLTDEVYPNKPNEQQVNTTQSWRAGGVSFNNTIGRRITPQGNRWDGGDLSFATYMKGLPLRGSVLYQPDSSELLTSGKLSTQLRLEENATLNLGGQYQPAAGLTTLDANLQRDLGPLAFGVQGSWQSDNNYQVGLNLGMQLAAQGSGPSWKVVPARSQGFGYGSADVIVFVDDNGNGVKDAGEETVEGVQVRNVRSGKPSVTDAQGMARMTDLMPNMETLVEIVENTLPDIYLKAASQWHVLVAHQGYGGKVEIPVLRLGEIGGELILSSGQSYRGYEIRLMDKTGKLMERLFAQVDGTFYFQSVPLGTYTVQVRKSDGTQVDKSVLLTRDEPIQMDIQFNL